MQVNPVGQAIAGAQTPFELQVCAEFPKHCCPPGVQVGVAATHLPSAVQTFGVTQLEGVHNEVDGGAVGFGVGVTTGLVPHAVPALSLQSIPFVVQQYPVVPQVETSKHLLVPGARAQYIRGDAQGPVVGFTVGVGVTQTPPTQLSPGLQFAAPHAGPGVGAGVRTQQFCPIEHVPLAVPFVQADAEQDPVHGVIA